MKTSLTIMLLGCMLVSCGAGRLLANDSLAVREVLTIPELLQQGRYHEAIVRLKEHLQTSPHDTTAQRRIIEASFLLGDYATAAAYATTLLSDHPDDTRTRMFFSLSMIFLRDAMDINDAATLLAYGRQCVAAGAYDAATYFYRRYLTIVPEDMATRQEYARMLSWQEPLTPAIAEYQEILERRPDDDSVRMEMARLMNRAGMHAAAARQFRRLLKRQPDAVAVRVELARALAWDGDNEGCAALLRELAARPKILELDSLPFLAKSAARLSCLEEERVFLVTARGAGVASSEMQARLHEISQNSLEAEMRAKDEALEEAGFDDFWQMVIEQRQAALDRRKQIGAQWAAQNRDDLVSIWETGRLYELLEQYSEARACYQQIMAASSTPQVQARLLHLGLREAQEMDAASEQSEDKKP